MNNTSENSNATTTATRFENVIVKDNSFDGYSVHQVPMYRNCQGIKAISPDRKARALAKFVKCQG